MVATVEATRNGASYKLMNMDRLEAPREYKLPTHVPSPEAVRAFAELLGRGEQREEPFQVLLTQHPSLLAATVVGASGDIRDSEAAPWRRARYRLPSARSQQLRTQWLLVEIEATRHQILNKDGSLSGPTRHAINQIEDWREWLTAHVAYAHESLKLHGLTNRAPGLVVLGRSQPTAQRQASRARSGEGNQISIHSWDWLLRSAHSLSANPIGFSHLARENAEMGSGFEVPEHLDNLRLIDGEDF